jgi:trypsin
LRQVALPIVADSPCQQVFDGVRNPAVFPKAMMCAGGDGKRDACTGDSGGPLLTRLASGAWELIGVTSWGDGCAVQGMPGVFTRLSAPEIQGFVAHAAGGVAFGP